MELTLHDHVTNSTHVFEGDLSELETKLRAHFPWLGKAVKSAGLAGLIARLNRSQRYSCDFEALNLDELPLTTRAPVESIVKSIGYLTFPRLQTSTATPVDKALVARTIYSKLDEKAQGHIKKLVEVAGYKPGDFGYDEQLLTQPQQYLMSDKWRDRIHLTDMKEPEERKAFHEAISRTWDKVLDLSRKVKAESDGQLGFRVDHALMPYLDKSEDFDPSTLAEDVEFTVLEKMALADVKPGQLVVNPYTKQKRYLYDHILPQHLKDEGYGLVVVGQGGESSAHSAEIYHKGNHAGQVVGMSIAGNRFSLHTAEIDKAHQNKGLGTLAYEALLAHAKNVLDCKEVVGDSHSTSASYTHRALARKHGLDYKPKADIGPDAYIDTEHWDSRVSGPFDFKYAPYKYELKSEAPMAKGEEEDRLYIDLLEGYEQERATAMRDWDNLQPAGLYRALSLQQAPLPDSFVLDKLNSSIETFNHKEVFKALLENYGHMKEVQEKMVGDNEVFADRRRYLAYTGLKSVAGNEKIPNDVFKKFMDLRAKELKESDPDQGDASLASLLPDASLLNRELSDESVHRALMGTSGMFQSQKMAETKFVTPEIVNHFFQDAKEDADSNRGSAFFISKLGLLSSSKAPPELVQKEFGKALGEMVQNPYGANANYGGVQHATVLKWLLDRKDIPSEMIEDAAGKLSKISGAMSPTLLSKVVIHPNAPHRLLAEAIGDGIITPTSAQVDFFERDLPSDFFDTVYERSKTLHSVPILSRDEANWIIQHKNFPEELLHRAIAEGHSSFKDAAEAELERRNPQLDQRFSKPADWEEVDGRRPSYDEETYSNAWDKAQTLRRVAFPIGTQKLRKLRDAILSTGKDSAPPKALIPGDWSKFRDKSGNISAKAIQDHIDTLPKHEFNVYHRMWTNGLQAHSKTVQKVTGFATTDAQHKALRESGVDHVYDEQNDKYPNIWEQHPHPEKRHGLGWVRWTGDEKGIHIDEIQTDLDFDNADPEHQKAKHILYGHNHPTEALHEAFLQHIRDRGWHNTPVHIWDAKPKSVLSGQDPDKPLPAHMYQTYGHSPKKMGYDPSTYGNLPEAQDSSKREGEPTHAGVIRKHELVKMAIADLQQGVRTRVVHGTEWYDYSHLLNEEQKAKGYRVQVRHNYTTGNIRSQLCHLSQDASVGGVGDVDGDIAQHPKYGTVLDLCESNIGKDHRGQGLGKALYEALYAHAYHVGGARHVMGGKHSTLASFTHKSLASKHGLDYVARPNYPSPGYANKAHWEEAKTGAYDGKYKGYNFVLKSETAIEQDDNLAQDMVGFSHNHHKHFEAAKFLAGHRDPVALDRVRSALWYHDGDVEAAALHAYNLDVTPENRKALKAVLELKGLNKAEEGALLHPGSIEPVLEEDDNTAEALRRAYGAESIQEVKLGGKHSKGTVIATDPATKHTYLLKPGDGLLVTAGANEERASQSRREAAFYGVAKLLGLQDFIPETTLLRIGGKEVAVLRMLPWSFKNLERFSEKHAPFVVERLNHYRAEGVLHKWAVLDGILANADRHGQNLMIDEEGRIRLIDHGSAFAGESFSPATDKNSFIPYYLRYTVAARFNAMETKKKLQYMPTVSSETDQQLQHWVASIDEQRLEQTLLHYGMSPKPVLDRLAKLKAAPAPKAEAINRFWVTE